MGQTPGFQPAYVESEPMSDMSVDIDQISIHLSEEGSDSARGEPNAEAPQEANNPD